MILVRRAACSSLTLHRKPPHMKFAFAPDAPARRKTEISIRTSHVEDIIHDYSYSCSNS
jgi:hypothetical protein